MLHMIIYGVESSEVNLIGKNSVRKRRSSVDQCDTESVGSLSSEGSCCSIDSDNGEDKQKHSLSVRLQKKILGKACTKTIISFIDEDTGFLLNTLYNLMKEHTGDAEESKKVVKYLIRILVKLAIFVRNCAFNDAELTVFFEFKSKYRTAALTFISFSEVRYTYDQTVLLQVFGELFDLLKQLTKRHLSPKSLEKLEIVQDSLRDKFLLDSLFSSEQTSPISQYLPPICSRVKNLIDQGKI